MASREVRLFHQFVAGDITNKHYTATIGINPSSIYYIHGVNLIVHGDEGQFMGAEFGFLTPEEQDYISFKPLVRGYVLPHGRSTYHYLKSGAGGYLYSALSKWFNPPLRLPPNLTKLYCAWWNVETTSDPQYAEAHVYFEEQNPSVPSSITETTTTRKLLC